MSEIQIIPIHFDVADHHLSLKTFIKSAQSIEKILEGFGEKFFEENPSIQVLVLPPKGGTFYETLGFFVNGGAAAAGWVLVNGAKPYIKGLTGKSFDEWVEQFGKSNKALLAMLVEAVKGFLERNNDALAAGEIKIENFPKAFAGRTDFYRVCQEDSEIKAIEFCKDGKFQIKKSDFCNYITGDHIKNLPPEKKLHKLAIVSPIIKKRKKSKLKWKAEDTLSNSLSDFAMEDDNFKTKFLAGDYPLKESGEDDVITGLFEYKKIEINGEVKLTNSVAAKKIYQFNDQKISDIPNNLKLEAVEIFESAKKMTKNEKKIFIDENQLSLFENLNRKAGLNEK
jgi:hypothetical protein